ncbi:uncharacterized protein ANIA_11392 [Aspergillus nidulans FGSC A4]|uniref:Uncharacterized protein n=1 Tax=Emericella nidulans (strain FGSC A4 / ATCC 38163 / CBS 112.46 / NRRL 194 / M139) TaxID=227321 RepID=C8VHP5_EMENI|nr:hypothetical protein [Aspergillus nidulans FGSC A4]CBF82827.1 TPA: hypothetical protein ANIA_11392 [Aspergillus nidulans FGSC A4]
MEAPQSVVSLQCGWNVSFLRAKPKSVDPIHPT